MIGVFLGLSNGCAMLRTAEAEEPEPARLNVSDPSEVERLEALMVIKKGFSEFTPELIDRTFQVKWRQIANPSVSPVAVYLGLSILGLASVGRTKAQLDKVLGWNGQSTETIILGLSVFIDELKTYPELKTTAYVFSSYVTSQQFVDYLKWSQLQVDGVGAHQPASVVNAIVDAFTEGMIPEVLTSDDYEMTILSLMLIKFKWLEVYEEEHVNGDHFTTLNGDQVPVEYLEMTETLPENVGPGYYSVIRKGTGSSFYGMTMLKEEHYSQSGSLATQSLKALFEFYDFETAYKDGDPKTVKHPKLDLKNSLRFNEILIALGLDGIFRGGLDLIDPDAFVSSAKHFAALKVDEEGASAAAAFVAVVYRGCGDPEDIPDDYFFDKPFIATVGVWDRQMPIGYIPCLVTFVTDPTVEDSKE